MTQSNRIPGMAVWASVSAGNAWIKSPIEESLTRRTYIPDLSVNRKNFFDSLFLSTQAMVQQIMVSCFLTNQIIQLDRPTDPLKGRISTPTIVSYFKNKARACSRRHFNMAILHVFTI